MGRHRAATQAAAAADLVLAIYNPASKTRTWQVGAMRNMLLAHRDPGTPCDRPRRVGPREEVKVVRLADLDPADVDMRCLLIVGSSQTQWYSEIPGTGSSRRADTHLGSDPHADHSTGPGRCNAVRLGSVLGTEVKRVDVEPIGTGQTGATYRVSATYAAERSDLPGSFAIKLSAQDDAVRERVALGYRSEVEFYSRIANEMRIPVPRSFHTDISEDGADVVLLLADMAPAVQGDQIAGCTAAEARLAAEALAGLHGRAGAIRSG